MDDPCLPPGWHHVAMPTLPARDLDSARLADHLGQPGCPGCRERHAIVERFTEAYLYESVNDVRFRGELDAARGLCGEHVHAMLRVDRRTSGGMLGPAILLDAMLRIRESELRAVSTARGPIRARRLREAARPAACPVCREVDARLENVLRHLVRLTQEPAWADAVADADLCLEHLVAMMGTSDRPRAWDAVERRQLERLRGLRERLIAFADHSAHERRHLVTEEERAAVVETAAVLGGEGPSARPSATARSGDASANARAHGTTDLR
jgi:Family of unknown function (DUF6062)